MFNIIVMIVLATSLSFVLSGAILCYHNRNGWHWFLLAGVLSFFSASSMVMSIELLKTMNIDYSQLIKPVTALEANK